MPQYTDLFIRDDLADVGHIPSEAATACYSPDIIVWGADVLPDPQIYLPQNYGTTWYKNVVADRENYIYCRAKNLGDGAAAGKLYLYYAIAGMLTDVAAWSKNKIPTGIIKQDYIKLAANAAGDVVVGDAAFEWVPPTGFGTHHCLVAQIVTERNPTPLPASFPTVEAYVKWVLDNPAIAWRNIDVIPSSGPPAYKGQIGFENLDDTAQDYLFVTQCFNVPIDTQLSMVCSVIGPEPQIDVSQRNTKTRWTLTTEATLPPKLVGSVDVSAVLAPGVTWPPNARLTFAYYIIVNETHPDYLRARARPLVELGLSVPGRSATDTHALRLGSYTAQTDTETTAERERAFLKAAR